MNDQDDLVDDLVCQCLQARAAGDPTAVATLLAGQVPAVRAEVEALLATLDRVGLGGDAAPGAAGASALPFGPYLLLERLGAGAMGVVYRARGPDGAECALKLLQPGLLPVRRARLRFDREVQALRELDHPGICPIRGAGEVDGVPFLVMPLLRGENLQRHFARGPAHTDTQRERLLALVAAIAVALHHAHERGFVHRDVKPANVLVGEDDHPIVLDFGLARLERDDAVTLSQSREVIGAPAYMAPEQIADGRAVDRRADVYALGAMLYEGLTGRCPYVAATRESLYRAILTGDVPPPSHHAPGLPRALDVVCLTALAREPDRRYRTAADFAADLARVQAGQRPHAQLPGAVLRTRRWLRRNPLPAALGIALFAACCFAFWQAAAVRRHAARDTALARATTALETLPADPVAAEAIAREAIAADPTVSLGHTALAAARAADREALVLPGHTATVTSLHGLGDGSGFVSASLDGTARIWPLHGGAPTRLQHGPGGIVTVAEQPGGDLVVTAGATDGTVRAFRRGDGTRAWAVVVLAAGQPVPVLAWSPDGRWLCAGGGGGAWLVDAAGTKRLLVAGEVTVTAAAWLDDTSIGLGGHATAAPNAARMPAWLRRYDVEPEAITPRNVVEVTAGVRSLQVRPARDSAGAGPDALVVAADDAAFLWASGASTLLALPTARSKRVTAATWTHDGTTAVTLSPTGRLTRWRADGSEAGAAETISWATDLTPHPTQPIVAIAGGFGVVQLRPVAGHTGALLGRRRIAAVRPAFTPDGAHLATVDRDHTIRVWPLWRREQPRFLCGDLVRTAVWCADGVHILTGSQRADDGSGCIRAWHSTTGALLDTVAFPDAVAKIVPTANGEAWLATSGRAGQGHVHVIASRDGSLRAPEAAGTAAATTRVQHFPIDAASLPDGRIAIAGEDGTILLLAAAGGTVQQELPLPAMPRTTAPTKLLAITAALDGREFWAGGPDGTLHRFERDGTGSYAHAGAVPLGDAIRQLEWVDDGSVLAAQANGVLQRVGPGDRRLPFVGHRDDICDVHWTRAGGGLQVASGDYSGVVRIWREDGTLVREYRAHTGPVWSVRFSPQGDRVLTASNDGTVRIWPAR